MGANAKALFLVLLLLPTQTCGCGPVGNLHFLQDILDMLARRGAADAEGGGDFFVGRTGSEEAEDFIFPTRQKPWHVG